MTDETLDSFLGATTLVRLEMTRTQPEAIRAKVGSAAFQELRRLANVAAKSSASHLAGANPCLVFIPGVMGSLLRGCHLPGVWWLDAVRARDKIDQLALSSDGGDPPDPRLHAEPFDVDISYEGFFVACIEYGKFDPVKLAYDWRKPLDASVDRLVEIFQQCYERSGRKKVHVVAHSMGGVLLRTALMRKGDELWNLLGRIVFLGTPHYGSPTIAYYIREHIRGTWMMWLLGKYLSRTTFRSLWGAVGLLPAPAGVYPGTRPTELIPDVFADVSAGYGHPCANFDLYDAGQWNLNLSIAERVNLQKILDYTKQLYESLFRFHRSELAPERRKEMAVIAGVGQETPFQVNILPGILYGTNTTLVTERQPSNPHREGDGSVPLTSAELEWVGDTRYVLAEHSALPNVPAVLDDVFRFLERKPMRLPLTREGALKPHLGPMPVASSTPMLDGTGLGLEDPSQPRTGMSSRWRVREPTNAELAALDSRLVAGQLPEFERVRLL